MDKITDLINDVKRYDLSANDIEMWLTTLNCPFSDIVTKVNNDTILYQMIDMLTPKLTRLLTIIRKGEHNVCLLTEDVNEMITRREYNILYLSIVQKLEGIGFLHPIHDIDIMIEKEIAKYIVDNFFPGYLLN